MTSIAALIALIGLLALIALAALIALIALIALMALIIYSIGPSGGYFVRCFGGRYVSRVFVFSMSRHPLTRN